MTGPPGPAPTARATSWFAPGRIEVLGKHTDYAGGNVLVCAVSRGVTATVTDATAPVSTARSTAVPGLVRLTGDGCSAPPALPPGHWGHYLRTVVARLQANFGGLRPVHVEVASTLPLASGMSSSSALLVAVAMALVEHHGIERGEAWRHTVTTPLELAGFLACIENGKTFGPFAGNAGVGTLGGSEDHTAMLCSEPGMLGQFSFGPPRLERRVPLDAGLAFVVAVSGVSAEKTGSAQAGYNNASLAAAEILRRWSAAGHDAGWLAEAVGQHGEGRDELAALLGDEPALLARLDHLVAESTQYLPQAVAALEAGQLAAFGELVDASQQAAQSLLGNQVPETVALPRLARELGALGASSFGAGFGGSVWALVPRSDAEGFAAAWLERYRRVFPVAGARAATMVTGPSAAAHRIDPQEQQ